MVLNELRHWPLVITVLYGEPTLEDQQQIFLTLETALHRSQPFATLRIYSNSDSLGRMQGIDQNAEEWRKINGAKLKNVLLGMATVVPVDEVAERTKILGRKANSLPSKVFDEHSAAIDWLNTNVFLPKGLFIDAEAINTLLSRLMSANT